MMIDFKQVFKIIKKKDFFTIIDLNPNMVTLNSAVDNIKFNLTESKKLRMIGTSCGCCGMEGKNFVLFKNGDIKLCGISLFGAELEITVFKGESVCDTCKTLKLSRLNRRQLKIS